MLRSGLTLLWLASILSLVAPVLAQPMIPQTPDELKALAAGKESSVAEMVALAEKLEGAYGDKQPPEAVRMLIAIAKHGSRMGAGEGWFGHAQSRYTWKWLAETHDADPATGIPLKRFRGSKEQFARLDRDRSGEITAGDLDWSDSHPFVQQSALVLRLFRQLDAGGDGRVTREDMNRFFDKVADGKEKFSADDLRDVLLAGGGGFRPGDAPTTSMLIKGLFNNELGSLHEGAHLEDKAPDFALKTQDGSHTVRLKDEIGEQPVVLFFGNFTCGPFRATHQLVDDVAQRWSGKAKFLGVYVREAHPTDGWHMESNALQGVKVAQPRTYEERVAVAQQCFAKLRYTMPLLVDDVDDKVGNAYSGMPARLYVIDNDGKIAYKGGRGPFGLKVGEMEQALVMTMLDRSIRGTP
jgi:peroxiredoxin